MDQEPDKSKAPLQLLSLAEFDRQHSLFWKKLVVRIGALVLLGAAILFGLVASGVNKQIPIKPGLRTPIRLIVTGVVLAFGAVVARSTAESCRFQCGACNGVFSDTDHIKDIRVSGRCPHCERQILSEVADEAAEKEKAEIKLGRLFMLILSVVAGVLFGIHLVLFPEIHAGKVSGRSIQGLPAGLSAAGGITSLIGFFGSILCLARTPLKALPGVLIGGAAMFGFVRLLLVVS